MQYMCPMTMRVDAISAMAFFPRPLILDKSEMRNVSRFMQERWERCRSLVRPLVKKNCCQKRTRNVEWPLAQDQKQSTREHMEAL
jgi:hypothetical protein